ncbi:MAG: FtsQ-type POTRA domain-containing protein [Oscillospiraceae bacterium]|nr:FtsQ-type POTRA domain-containing protein [Oscillospiraceae bacterium]
MDTKEKERVRRPQSEKPKAKAPGKGTPKTKRPSPTASRSNVKGQAQTSRRKPSQTKQKRSIAEDVVYLPPKPFSRKRLLLRLATVVAVVFAFVFSVSIFFKVEKVVVSGNERYSAEAILEASGIQMGDKLLTFSRAKAGGKIIGKLHFVENVRFGIKLPGTVYIEITEVEVGYAVSDANGTWWLISAGGKVLQQLSSGENSGYTNVLGFKLEKPVIGSQAVALEEEQPTTDEAGNTIPVAVTAEKRLSTAMNILQYLEQNGIIGEAAFVDVTDLSNISMQYGSRYQVLLGNDTQLSYKISILKAAAAKVSEDYPYSTGTLNLSDPNNIRFDQTDS